MNHRSLPEEASVIELSPHIFRSCPATLSARLANPDHPSDRPLRLWVVSTGRLSIAQYPSNRRCIIQIPKYRLKLLQTLEERSDLFRWEKGRNELDRIAQLLQFLAKLVPLIGIER